MKRLVWRAALLIWLGLPTLITRFSTLAGAALADGCFVLRWPGFACALPLAAFGLGALFGKTHAGDSGIATYSLLPLVIGTLLGMFGGAPGAWFGIGYALLDFVSWPHQLPLERPALPIAYVLLLLLTMAIPAVGKVWRVSLWRLRPNANLAMVALAAVLAAAICAGMTAIWVNAFPALIRPVYTWPGGQPPTSAVATVQSNPYVLPACAALAAALRTVLERIGMADSRLAGVVATFAERVRAGSHLRLPLRIGAPLGALVTTYLVSGMFDSWQLQVLFFAVATASILGREALSTALAPLTNGLARVPIVLRLCLAYGLSYAISSRVLELGWSTDAFTGVVISAAIGFVLLAVLLPVRRVKPA